MIKTEQRDQLNTLIYEAINHHIKDVLENVMRDAELNMRMELRAKLPEIVARVHEFVSITAKENKVVIELNL